MEETCQEVAECAEKGVPTFAGIDPGADGAVAFRCGERWVFVADIPTIRVRKAKGYKTEFNLPVIAAALAALPASVRFAVEEAQIQIAGKASSMTYTAFRVGYAYAIWPAMLTAFGLPFEVVSPRTWKQQMGLTGKDKESSRHKALGMFPKADILRKKDHNRAEAILIAEWYRRRCNGGR